MKSILIFTISLFAVSLSGQAATTSLESCSAIDDPGERLACYDTLAGRLPAQTAEAVNKAPGEIEPPAPVKVVSEPPAPAAAPAVSAVEPGPDAVANFGLKDNKKTKKEHLEELKLKWVNKKRDGYGKWIITLENGQIWHQTDTRRFSFTDPEQWVVIYRGALGSFFMGELERRNGIRVKRVK